MELDSLDSGIFCPPGLDYMDSGIFCPLDDGINEDNDINNNYSYRCSNEGWKGDGCEKDVAVLGRIRPSPSLVGTTKAPATAEEEEEEEAKKAVVAKEEQEAKEEKEELSRSLFLSLRLPDDVSDCGDTPPEVLPITPEVLKVVPSMTSEVLPITPEVLKVVPSMTSEVLPITPEVLKVVSSMTSEVLPITPQVLKVVPSMTSEVLPITPEIPMVLPSMTSEIPPPEVPLPSPPKLKSTREIAPSVVPSCEFAKTEMTLLLTPPPPMPKEWQPPVPLYREPFSEPHFYAEFDSDAEICYESRGVLFRFTAGAMRAEAGGSKAGEPGAKSKAESVAIQMEEPMVESADDVGETCDVIVDEQHSEVANIAATPFEVGSDRRVDAPSPVDSALRLNVQSETSLSPSAGGPFCRICLDADDAAALIAPCLCRGSGALTHTRCLQTWLRVRLLSAPAGADVGTCGICKGRFRVRIAYKREGKRIVNKRDVFKLILWLYCLSFCVFSPLLIFRSCIDYLPSRSPYLLVVVVMNCVGFCLYLYVTIYGLNAWVFPAADNWFYSNRRLVVIPGGDDEGESSRDDANGQKKLRDELY